MPGRSVLSVGGDLRLKQVAIATDHVGLVLEPRRAGSRCPSCSTLSRRIHGRYTRSLADLPIQGVPVRVRLEVRKFRCAEELCDQLMSGQIDKVASGHEL